MLEALRIIGWPVWGDGPPMPLGQSSWKCAKIRARDRVLYAPFPGSNGMDEIEDRFRSLADSAPVLMWMSGLDAGCTFLNKGWLDFTGRSLEQELGDGWSQGVHVDDLDGCLRIYRDAFQARRAFEMEYRLRRHDGQYRW